MRILILFLFCLTLNGCAYYFGDLWQSSFKRIEPTEYPKFDSNPKPIAAEQLQNHPLVLHFAERDVVRPTKKDQRGPERLLLAKLTAGKDVKAVNEYLLNSTPWGNSGTSGKLNPKGDYDFTTVILAAILFKFQHDTTLLWPQTAEHLAKVLLVEEGGRPHKKTPRTMAIMRDTENHILMTNISQYLKNQWLQQNGSVDGKYNNLENGLEEFLLDNLEELQITGQYEFNSKPYEGYTISALLILQSYCDSDVLKAKATATLNNICWEYMLTSSVFRKSSPFRRRMARHKNTSLTDNASSSMMKAWFLEHEKSVFELDEIPHNHHQALSALVYDYRPPNEIWKVDDQEQFIQIGHGYNSSPEMYSRGKGFMLCAGGFQRGEVSQIVARPIVLMLDDDAVDLTDCFHLTGKGEYTKWNNTGVHHRFAVGTTPVSIPAKYKASDTLGNWKLFQPSEGVSIVTYSEENFGLIYLPQNQVRLSEMVQLNPNPASGVFRKTESSLTEFSVKAPKGKWVIQGVNDRELYTKTDKWPRVRVTTAF